MRTIILAIRTSYYFKGNSMKMKLKYWKPN